MMAGVKVLLLLAFLSCTSAAEDPEKRPTRTIARLLGFERSQPPQQQQQVTAPLVYNVKYYDRAGENPEVQVEQAHPQPQVVQQQVPVQQQGQGPYQSVAVPPFQDRVVPSTRVFLNLYTGQQTPVYYDSKGQLYVPCPAYDHNHQVHSGPAKPVVHVQAAGQKSVVGNQPYNQPEYVYYAGPPPQQVPQQKQVQQKVPYVAPIPVPVVPELLYYTTPPQQQQVVNNKVVGYPPASTVVSYNPYDVPVPYAYYPSPYGFGYPGTGYPGQGGYVNPFVYVKPAQVTVAPGQSAVTTTHVHSHVHPNGQQQQQTDQVVVEKKNVSEKTEGQ